MGLLPSIAATLSFSLPAGPAGMVWSWFLASGCIFVVGLVCDSILLSSSAEREILAWRLDSSRMLSRTCPLTRRISLGHGGFGKCHANDGRVVLLDSFLCQSKDQELSLFLGWLQQQLGPHRQSLQHRLRFCFDVLFLVSPRPYLPSTHA